MSSIFLQELRPAGQYALRRRHNFLSNEIWGGAGSTTPSDVVGLEVDGSGDNVRNESGGPWIPFQPIIPFPTYGDGGEGSIGEVLNRKERFEREQEGYKYAPIDLTGWGEPQSRSLSAHIIYNVKTWRLQATVAGVSFDQDIPAGAITTLGSPGTRPNSGKRGRYGFACSLTDSNEDSNVNITASIAGGNAVDISNAQEHLFADPVDGVYLPEIYFSISLSVLDDEGVGTSQSLATTLVFGDEIDDRGSTYSGVTFCGLPFLLFDLGSLEIGAYDPWTYSLTLTISPKELWESGSWQS
jgi:hypothetical protein